MSAALPLGPSLHEAAEAQLTVALAALAPWSAEGTAPEGTDRAQAALGIHEARKAVKRLRALLRLSRGPMGAAYAEEDQALRDLNRGLSALRDADAALEALERLAAHTGDPALAGLREQLAVEGPDPAPGLHEAAAALARMTDRVRLWPLGTRWRALRGGFRRTYSRGRQAWRRARRTRDTEDLHAWRKEVKHLGFQLRVLRAAWPGALDAWAAELGQLADWLGDDHDLAVLTERLSAGEQALSPALAAHFAARREALQSAALALGARLYGEEPAPLTRRVGRWVRGAPLLDPAAPTAEGAAADPEVSTEPDPPAAPEAGSQLGTADPDSAALVP